MNAVVGLLVKGFHMGGMQSILGGITRALQSAGCRVVFLTSEGEEDDFYAPPLGCKRVVVGHWRDESRRTERRNRIVRTLKANGVDVLFHHLYDASVLADDIAAARECGVKTVVHFHSAATSLFARTDGTVRDVGKMFDAYRSADALICLSQCDETLFRALGVRARYIPNPMPIPPEGFRRRATSDCSLLWVGRFSKQEKRPQDAIAAFEEIRKVFPDATLTLLGDGSCAHELRQMVSSDMALANAVRMPGKSLDVWSELAKAKVLLLTSAYEGFSCAVAEAYAAGVPVAGYKFENLELCKDAEAYHAAPHGDVQALARTVVRLLSDEPLLARAGAAAKSTYDRFVAFDLASAYEALIEDVLSDRHANAFSSQPGTPYGEILRTFFVHACMGRLRYLDAKAKLAKRPNSIRGCIRFVLSRIFRLLGGGRRPT